MHSALFASLLVYGVLLLVGGIIGYVKARSRASLISGIACAVLLGGAAGLVWSGAARLGAGLGVVIAFALVFRFLPAFLRTRRFMPGGAVVIVGALVIALGALTLVTGL